MRDQAKKTLIEWQQKQISQIPDIVTSIEENPEDQDDGILSTGTLTMQSLNIIALSRSMEKPSVGPRFISRRLASHWIKLKMHIMNGGQQS